MYTCVARNIPAATPTGPLATMCEGLVVCTYVPAEIGDVSATVALSKFSHFSQVTGCVQTDLLQVNSQQGLPAIHYK